MTRTHRLPRTLRTLTLAAAATAALSAQAVPVTVSIGGLPPGLSPEVAVTRNACGDGLTWISNASQPLTETSLTTFEQVALPGGGFTLRPKVVTRYVASFDTPATVDRGVGQPERPCRLGGQADLFHFTVKVPGVDAADRPTTLDAFVGETPQAGPVVVNTTLGAGTVGLGPTFATVTRGVVNRVDARHVSAMGAVRSQRVDLLRPSPLVRGLFLRVASLFVRSDGVACVQSGSVTRCFGDSAAPEAGGVVLRGFSSRIFGEPNLSRFQYELTPAFPVGPLKLRASADAADLAAYLVDGAPEPLDLLPWQSREIAVTVQ